MIKHPPKKTNAGRGMVPPVNKTGSKGYTPGPMKLPSKKSENMGYDPSISLVNSSKPGWSKPQPMVPTPPPPPPPVEGPPQEPPLPTSSVWGRKSDTTKLDPFRESEFPLPSTSQPKLAAKESPPLAHHSPPLKPSAMCDWALDDANAEMDFNQPLFAGHKLGQGPPQSNKFSTHSQPTYQTPPPTTHNSNYSYNPEHRHIPGPPTAIKEKERERAPRQNVPEVRIPLQNKQDTNQVRQERDTPSTREHFTKDTMSLTRLNPMAVNSGVGQGIPLLREKPTKEKAPMIPASGPRIVQQQPVPLKPGQAWATPTAVSSAPAPLLPGQWPEPQQLQAIQQMEQQQAREKAAAEREQLRKAAEENQRRLRAEQEKKIREEEAKKRLQALRDQKDIMTQKAQEATEKRQQEDEEEERERKERLRAKLLALEEKAKEEEKLRKEAKEEDSQRRPPKDKRLEDDRHNNKKRRPGNADDYTQRQKQPQQPEPTRPADVPKAEPINPWKQRMQQQTPSLLLAQSNNEQNDVSGRGGDRRGRGGRTGRGQGRRADDPEYGRRIFHQPFSIVVPGAGTQPNGEANEEQNTEVSENKTEIPRNEPAVDWGTARTVERVVQPTPEPLQEEESAVRGSRGRGQGRGIWEPQDKDDTRRLRGVQGAQTGRGRGRGVRPRPDHWEHSDDDNHNEHKDIVPLESDSDSMSDLEMPPPRPGARMRKFLKPRWHVPMITTPVSVLTAWGGVGRGIGKVKMVVNQDVVCFEYDADTY